MIKNAKKIIQSKVSGKHDKNWAVRFHACGLHKNYFDIHHLFPEQIQRGVIATGM